MKEKKIVEILATSYMRCVDKKNIKSRKLEAKNLTCETWKINDAKRTDNFVECGWISWDFFRS